MSVTPPSARFEAGDPRPLGFQNQPSTEHIDRASDALAALATEINSSASPAPVELAICLCSVRFIPGSPFQLFGFHVPEIDAEGGFVDPGEAGHEVRYALVVNHPAEVQVESAIAVLFQLVERRRLIAEAQAAGDLSQIDRGAAASDARADREFLDISRFGWRESAASLARKAAEQGARISVRYQRDPFTDREEQARRIPLLRQTYNEIDSARRAIDNTVSMIGGSHGHIRFAGAPAKARDDAQARLALLAMRQFQNQSTRDAEVCGNGYMLLHEGADVSPRVLRPENVEIDGAGNYFELDREGRRPLSDVLHLRGIDQIDSPYGISALEPVLFALDQIRTFSEVREGAERILASPEAGPNEREWATGSLALVERTLAAVEERVSQLVGFTRDELPEAKPDLYFPGQELMR